MECVFQSIFETQFSMPTTFDFNFMKQFLNIIHINNNLEMSSYHTPIINVFLMPNKKHFLSRVFGES